MPAWRISRATRLRLTAQPESQREFGVHPRRAVGAAGLLVDLLDVFEQQLVLLVRAAIPAGAASRSSPIGDTLKHPAGHRDIESVVGEFTDQREHYFGRMFSRAKYAAARLRISILHLQPALIPAQLGEFLLLLARQLRSRCRSRRRRPGPSNSAGTIPKSAGLSRTQRPVWSPSRASSTARRRNSGGCGAGTSDILPGGRSHLRSGVRAPGGSSTCAQTTMTGFLDNPTKPVDHTCAAQTTLTFTTR